MGPVVVVGRGSIGQRHAAVFRDLLGDAAVAQVPAGMREGQSVEDLVEQILALAPSHAVIASPAHRHLALAVPLLKAGVPCLIEKPLALTGVEARAFVERPGSTARVQVGYNLHYRPEYAWLADQLSGIGPLIWAEFRCGQALEQWRPGRPVEQCVTARADWGGGVLRELSHELEMATALLGPLRVRHALAQWGRYGQEVEEAVSAGLETRAGCPVTVALDLYRAQPERRVLLVGRKGQLEADFVNRRLTLSAGDTTDSRTVEAVDSYRMQAEAFLAGRDAPGMPSLADAVATMTLIDELEDALQ